MQKNAQYGLDPLGYQQITSLVAAVSLTIPAGCSMCIITPQTQAVRWRDDGVDPTATVGYPLAVGQELTYDSGRLPSIKFIEQTASATLNISYYGRKV